MTAVTSVVIPVGPAAKAPNFQVLYAPTFGATFGVGTKSTTSWTVLQQPNGILYPGGVELEYYKREAFPNIGTAIFHYVYGKIGGVVTAAPPVLDYNEVRLQLYDTINAKWVTVFWGQVIQSERVGSPGSATPQGIMRYHVVDGFARALKWVLNHCGYDSGFGAGTPPRTHYTGATGNYGPYRGNPGYNYMLASDGPLLGNKSPTAQYTIDGNNVNCHIYQGAMVVVATNPAYQTLTKWQEIDMINHACASVKPVGEPLFILPAAATPANHGYYVATPQPVYSNETVHDFVMRVTNRQRGNGVVWVDWVDNGDGSLSVALAYCPINIGDITYAIPGSGGTMSTIEGANTTSQVYLFDGDNKLVLTGDHRNVDDDFALSDASAHLVDMVETLGEQIEVAVTLCANDGLGTTDDMASTVGFYSDNPSSLQPRWSKQDVTNFVALTWDKRVAPYWDFIYQSFGLPRDWGGTAGDGLGTPTNQVRVDYRCLASGEIYAPLDTDTSDTPPFQVELLGYLPFYEGFDYSGSYPRRTDSAQLFGLPQRRPVLAMLNTTGWENNVKIGAIADFWYLPGGQLPQNVTDERVLPQTLSDYFSPAVTVQPDGIICKNSNSQNGGIRVISDPVADVSLGVGYVLGANLPVTRLAFTVGLKMPHTLYFANFATGVTDWQHARKRKTIYIENANLWLAAPNCIYDLSQTSDGLNGYAAVRGAAGGTISGLVGTPGVLRDDRPMVYRYHVLASAWYLNPRSRLRYSMRFCTDLPFTYLKSGAGTTGQHPKLGQYIQQVYADSPTALIVGTIVTSVEYRHQEGISTVETDFFDLEHV